MNNIKHIIFDLDGVITNTASLHCMAWRQTFNKFLSSINFSELFSDADYHNYVDGKSREDGIISFMSSRGLDLSSFKLNNSCFDDLDQLASYKNNKYVQLISSSTNLLMDGFIDFLDLFGGEMRFSVASSSMNAYLLLELCGIKNRFKLIVGGSDLKPLILKSKPSPDIFNYVIQNSGYAIHNTMIIEDSISGVVAARDTGCPAVVGFNVHNNDEYEKKLIGAGAHFAVSNYKILYKKFKDNHVSF